MERQVREKNYRELSEEIINAGFPVAILPALRREMGRVQAGHVTIPFENGLDRAGMTGKIHLEPEYVSRLYRFTHFDVDLGKDTDAPTRRHSFDRIAGHETTLRQAVNLMEGRSIYREPGSEDGARAYWISLNPRPGPVAYSLEDYHLSDYTPEKAIRDSPLAKYLSVAEREKLALEIRQGDRAEINIQWCGQMRQLFVEAHPQAEQLKLTDKQGERIKLPELRTIELGQEGAVRQRRGRGR